MKDRLNPSDIPVALRLVLHPGELYESLAHALGIGLSSAHRSVSRLHKAGLLRSDKRVVNRLALSEFLRHGIQYAFPASAGPIRRGVPTAYSAPPLVNEIVSDVDVVWPSASGSVEGISVHPLYEDAPGLIDRDPELYQLLALVDAIRFGQAREKQRAVQLLDDRLLRPDDQVEAA
jgi:hypothetical protein